MKEVKVTCQVCHKKVSTAVVKDFAHNTYYACGCCIKIMARCHPSTPVVVRDVR